MTEFNHNMHDEIAEGERWLAGKADASAPAVAIGRTKDAVRAELARRARTVPGMTWRPWHGTLAAAAALALCVTIGWQSMRSYSRSVPPTDEGGAIVFLPAASETQLAAFDTLEQELSEIEAWDSDQASLSESWEDVWRDSSENNGRSRG